MAKRDMSASLFISIGFLSLMALSMSIDLPPRLERLGIKLFRSKQLFQNFLMTIADPSSLDIYGTTIYLAQRKNDNGLQKLKHEFSQSHDGYGLKRLLTIQNGTMIDIGANIGAISIFLAKRAPKCQIISFEPIPQTYFFFRYNMYLNNITVIKKWERGTNTGGIMPINQAVGALQEVKEITYPANQSQLAALSDSPDGHKINITVASFNDIIRRYDIGVIDFLKIDCEGCEFDVIPSIQERFVDKNKIRFVGAEIHQSLMDPSSKPLAKRPNQTSIDSTLSALRQRGCKTDTWNVEC